MMTRRVFNRVSLLILLASVGYMTWVAANLDWHRFGRFGITADLPRTTSSRLAFVLPPILLLLYVVGRRLFFGPAPSGYDADVLFERLRELALRDGNYAVFGSGPLAVRGLIDQVGDLDVIVRGANWDRVREAGTVVWQDGVETVDLGNGLTFGRSWAFGDFDIDELIDDAELIDGLRFVRLESVVAYKRIAGRAKDLRHIEILTAAGLI